MESSLVKRSIDNKEGAVPKEKVEVVAGKTPSEIISHNPDPSQEITLIRLSNLVKLRPFIQRYTRGVKLPDNYEHQWIRQHTNNLLLFGISQTHPLVVKKDKVIDVDFTRLFGQDRESWGKLVSGKKKSNFFIEI